MHARPNWNCESLLGVEAQAKRESIQTPRKRFGANNYQKPHEVQSNPLDHERAGALGREQDLPVVRLARRRGNAFLHYGGRGRAQCELLETFRRGRLSGICAHRGRDGHLTEIEVGAQAVRQDWATFPKVLDREDALGGKRLGLGMQEQRMCMRRRRGRDETVCQQRAQSHVGERQSSFAQLQLACIKDETDAVLQAAMKV
uniref:Uncharacterized protein n=1 Tax=Calcidiscus leptoporus TaxID=127549 RepID=A0A7S0ITI9_9EUKA|mmetsp:Transcript_22288/g.51295  ORF Transcript_22288/g.51295 Transcript_22288/m.51295 type:complete len:201 (+) Transcript_22288:243-845(+)